VRALFITNTFAFQLGSIFFLEIFRKKQFQSTHSYYYTIPHAIEELMLQLQTRMTSRLSIESGSGEGIHIQGVIIIQFLFLTIFVFELLRRTVHYSYSRMTNEVSEVFLGGEC